MKFPDYYLYGQTCLIECANRIISYTNVRASSVDDSGVPHRLVMHRQTRQGVLVRRWWIDGRYESYVVYGSALTARQMAKKYGCPP